MGPISANRFNATPWWIRVRPIRYCHSPGNSGSELLNLSNLLNCKRQIKASFKGLLCGPAKITVEGFRATYNEVLFIEMNPSEGEYEPLLGYVVLEQCGAAIDMLGHRIIPVKYLDLK